MKNYVISHSAMILFKEKAVTLSKSECDVKIQCDCPEEASMILEFLEELVNAEEITIRNCPEGE